MLPAALPDNTQAVEFGVIVDDFDVHLVRAFVADYFIAGKDVSLYEKFGNLVFASSSAQKVRIGTLEGQLFEDASGNRILQWYQNGMTCQLASTLSKDLLIALARQFRPITRWELLF